MLGYVRIDKGELKVREYEVYTGYYCGICKSIGKRYGQLPRMALSYDAAFLAILLESLGEDSDGPLQERCIANPLKKRTVIYNRAVDYAGDVMLILAWYKLVDDIEDEGKTYARAATLLLRKLHRRLMKKYPHLCRDIEKGLSELRSLEKDRCPSIDMAAESFSKIMEAIFTEGIRTLYGDGSEKTVDNARRIGYHMGKWIYLIDAVDDIEENIESGSYNPLLYRFSYDGEKETPKEFRDRIEKDLRFNLFHYLAVTSSCIEELDIKKNRGIIENIIYFGMNGRTEDIITRTDRDDGPHHPAKLIR